MYCVITFKVQFKVRNSVKLFEFGAGKELVLGCAGEKGGVNLKLINIYQGFDFAVERSK